MKEKIIKYLNKMKTKKILISFIISFAILFNICTYTVFAKYISESVENINLKIQEPIIEIEGENNKEITITTEKVSYEFKVKNYNNEDQINKINLEYYIEIDSERLDVFKVKLYKGEQLLNLNNYKTEVIELSNKEKKLDEYHLEVFPLDDINENINSKIKIKVHCSQKN